MSQSNISTTIRHQKSSASTVIYLVLQFIYLIYDETELLDFTALALPAGKNLTATCGIYSERKLHYIESFPYMRDPSQQVTENSKPIFAVRCHGGGLRAPLLSGPPGAARTAEAPRRCLSESGGSSHRGRGSRARRLPAGSRWESQQRRSEAGSRGGGATLTALGCSHAAGGGGVGSAGDEFSGTNIFPSIRRCPSAIAWTQVRERDGICYSLTSQYLCLKRVVDVAMKLGVV